MTAIIIAIMTTAVIYVTDKPANKPCHMSIFVYHSIMTLGQIAWIDISCNKYKSYAMVNNHAL